MGASILTLVDASAALEKTDKRGQVAEADASDRILRRYTLQECREGGAQLSARCTQLRRLRHTLNFPPPDVVNPHGGHTP
jgi:hypothetical protein